MKCFVGITQEVDGNELIYKYHHIAIIDMLVRLAFFHQFVDLCSLTIDSLYTFVKQIRHLSTNELKKFLYTDSK